MDQEIHQKLDRIIELLEARQVKRGRKGITVEKLIDVLHESAGQRISRSEILRTMHCTAEELSRTVEEAVRNGLVEESVNRTLGRPVRYLTLLQTPLASYASI